MRKSNWTLKHWWKNLTPFLFQSDTHCSMPFLIFAFCESWKSRRSSLFSRDANKESLLWKLNGAQKLIEPEDTILSKSTKDILKIFLVLRLSVNYADRALKFLEIVSFRFGIIFQNLFAQRNRTCLAFHFNKIGKNR